MVSSKFIILFFGISSQIGITFGNVHAVFDVGGDDPEDGGCQAAELNKVEDTFTEAIEMVGLIRNAITDLRAGTEPPAESRSSLFLWYLTPVATWKKLKSDSGSVRETTKVQG